MGNSQPGDWTNSAGACFVFLSFVALVALGFFGLGTTSITWIYTEGPFSVKAFVTIVLGLFLWAIFNFVRYINEVPMHDEGAPDQN